MAIDVLNIVGTAYRATLEEQDDPVVWITQAMRGAGANIDVLLRGNAVNYAVKGQDAAGLVFGAWNQSHPPDVARDLAQVLGGGGRIFLVREDETERGIEHADLIDGVTPVEKGALAGLLDRYDHVWHW